MLSPPLLAVADIHRQICIDILNSALPHGAQADFAAKVGISRQWLHRIRQAELPSMASYDLARRIAEHLPVTKQNADAFLEHFVAWQEAHRGDIELIRGIRSEHAADQVLFEFVLAHKVMAFSKDCAETNWQFQKMRGLGELILRNLNHQLFPLEYVRVCTLLSEVYLTLDLPADGLYWAKFARLIVEHLSFNARDDDWVRFLDYTINVCRHEGVAYSRLGLRRQAQACFRRAESYISLHPNPNNWIPFISLSRLSLLSTTPRFVLADAGMLVAQIEDSCERAGYDSWDITINEHLARVYMAYGNKKKAKRILRDLTIRTEESPAMGVRQQAMAYRTLARFAWVSGDKTTWEEAVKTAVVLTWESGLLHSYHALLNEFGILPVTHQPGLQKASSTLFFEDQSKLLRVE